MGTSPEHTGLDRSAWLPGVRVSHTELTAYRAIAAECHLTFAEYVRQRLSQRTIRVDGRTIAADALLRVLDLLQRDFPDADEARGAVEDAIAHLE